MGKYVMLAEKLAEIEEQGKRLRRRQDYLKSEHAFLVETLLDRPTNDMTAQRQLLAEWEDEIDKLERSLEWLRGEYVRLKERQKQNNTHIKNKRK